MKYEQKRDDALPVQALFSGYALLSSLLTNFPAFSTRPTGPVVCITMWSFSDFSARNRSCISEAVSIAYPQVLDWRGGSIIEIYG